MTHPRDDMLRRASVLIADRSQFARRLTRNMLANLGVRSVDEVEDGSSALEAISLAKPSILVTERDLPGISGLEVIRAIRSPDVFPYPDLPIVMLTMHAEREDVLRALRCGANEFLAKPASTLALRDRLISALSGLRPMVKIGDFYVPQPRAGRRRGPGQTSFLETRQV